MHQPFIDSLDVLLSILLAQIRRTEEILSRFSLLEEKFKKISEVDEKLDLIIEHLKISKPVKSMEIDRFA